ncbi:Metal-dependent hydrolase, beta-lactamase superfamily II [Lutibacter oricola]|uniref:Metal-dependent hydrolase, beta-lactamase superfamily II n=1 Tax=Lutibacter oricola TaxID=762486 RepID=A0A1H2YP63_9FLAO|nr:MBL fold metallo-hydrolase [Lutibacter oricola]SDX06434.1 Metal-dependent hydrolase, beta-lactamase superfamily II [Lutibacter oricola]
MEVKFIGFPEAVLKSKPKGGKTVKKVLWGDWTVVLDEKDDYRKIKCRGAYGWVHKDRLQDERLLEINFVDVGQGDGCFVVTPKDEVILVDAGEADNMYRFLRWRYNLNRNRYVVPIKHLIITHPDQDHYYGFRDIVASSRFAVENVYHNGIVERKGKDVLGKKENGFLTEIAETHQQVVDVVSNDALRGRKRYPTLLNNVLKKQPDAKITMLKKGSEIDGYTKNDDLSLEILGPLTEEKNGKTALKYFKSISETKNGHSVIVQLKYGNVKVLLGGDTNNVAEEYLSEHYTGFNPKTVAEADKEEMMRKGRAVFQTDILKSCHHGSHKFLDDFLSFFNPVATIISSGDNETHTHPRPETLGAIGKHSRGIRPLIFSTELARSAKEKTELKEKDILLLANLYKKRKAASTSERKKINSKIDNIKYQIQRNIAVYGMINVRTDGEKVIIAQKKEAKGAGFIIYELHPNSNGELEFKM